jgi:hypothetical protein
MYMTCTIVSYKRSKQLKSFAYSKIYLSQIVDSLPVIKILLFVDLLLL